MFSTEPTEDKVYIKPAFRTQTTHSFGPVAQPGKGLKILLERASGF